ncbi:hypothetical protein AVEN_231310-1 [Araneus ventricosus]|uniref:Uncharacterized protein n=1 Tax=Araneus ventricosus TaxID=182803 RepID=A0A4Y2CJB3_ARAVE|nr:hypothetical protein AVEN_231310-1 [Araneus ventricosus]
MHVLMTERFYNSLRFLNSRDELFSSFSFIGIHRVSATIRTSQRTSLLDESRWEKHGERYATVIIDDRGNASRLRSSMGDRGAWEHRCLRCIGKHRW